MRGLKDKVVLITGASSGIGAAAALAFNAAGARVALASRRKERLKELAAQLNDTLVITVDLGEDAAARDMVRKVVAYYGRIDILVNNAASIIVSMADSVTSEDLLLAFKTNLTGPVAATQEAILNMRKQGSGHIINIGSPGFMLGIPFYAPYVCSKAAFSAWTRTIQAEWADSGIFVSEYFPGYIKTDSKPDSRIGEVEQDLLMTEKQNYISRLFTKPKTPEQVASQLVKLALTPKLLTYSGVSVQLGAWISNITTFRLSMAKQMAKTARIKKNLPIFTK